jgi:hypothetical protein
MFSASNDNGVHDPGEQVIRDHSLVAHGLTIQPNFGITYPGTVLVYDGTGRLLRPGGQGLVIGNLKLKQAGDERTLCFASLRLRVVNGAACT